MVIVRSIRCDTLLWKNHVQLSAVNQVHRAFFDTIVPIIVVETQCYSFGNFLTKTQNLGKTHSSRSQDSSYALL